MLSISGRGSSGGAEQYFEAHLATGDYYMASPGRWHAGPAAKTLTLPRQVTAEHFRLAAQGFDPGGKPLVKGAGPQHRAGWDCCLSAPKSVSVLWAQTTGTRQAAIAAAHERAVDAAIGLLEELAIRVRLGHGGTVHVPGKVLAAQFLHDCSRALDPQLHSHVFVHNCALRSDGHWGAIESSYLYRWQTTIGTAYRAQLANELRQLGYAVEADSRAFRVSGVPESACKAFSQRRSEIELAAKAGGVTSAAGFEAVALATRHAKVEVDPEALRRTWRDRGAAAGFGASEAEELRGAAIRDIHDIDVDSLVLDLTAHKAVFRTQDVWLAVAERAQVAGGGIARIRAVVADVLSSAELVPIPGDRFTTRAMLELERQAMLAAWTLATQRGHASDSHVCQRPLSDEQSRALAHVLGDSGIAVVEGRAGTGKSYMLGAARECWQHAGFRVIGAALAGKAAQGLQDGSGIQSQTLHSLLSEIQGGRLRLDSRTVLVLDEGGMVGTAQMQQLLSATAAAGAKVVLVGDSCQLQSIDAGGVFRRLSRDLGAAEMAEIRRQRNADDRETVVDLMEGRAGAALERLGEAGRIHVCDGQPKTVASMVSDWVRAFDPCNPAATLMLAATRADVREINAGARRVRRESGALGPEEVVVSGSTFAVGDRVLFLRNDQRLGVKNGTLGTVQALDKGSLVIEIDGGQSVTVAPDAYPHITHGYAVTAHKSQGVTADHVLVFVSDRMASREWGYVAGSRHRDELHIYSDRSVFAGIAQDLSRSDPKTMALDELPVVVVDLPIPPGTPDGGGTGALPSPTFIHRWDKADLPPELPAPDIALANDGVASPPDDELTFGVEVEQPRV